MVFNPFSSADRTFPFLRLPRFLSPAHFLRFLHFLWVPQDPAARFPHAPAEGQTDLYRILSPPHRLLRLLKPALKPLLVNTLSHNFFEFNNLASILPEVYAQEKDAW